MTYTLPDQFIALTPFLAKWAKPTESQRQAERLSATPAQLQEFYGQIMPLMDSILKFLDQHPYGQLPEEHRPLYWLAMSLAEVAPHVELYGGSTGVPYAFEESRFVAEHGDTVNI